MSAVILAAYIFAAAPVHIKPVKVPEQYWHVRTPFINSAVRVTIIKGYYYYVYEDGNRTRYVPMYDNRGKMIPAKN